MAMEFLEPPPIDGPGIGSEETEELEREGPSCRAIGADSQLVIGQEEGAMGQMAEYLAIPGEFRAVLGEPLEDDDELVVHTRVEVRVRVEERLERLDTVRRPGEICYGDVGHLSSPDRSRSNYDDPGDNLRKTRPA
jgi:hypothetical protein